jgi:phosphatidylserine/phosphatidylglycerophosphate/cardiolipin synthase-like enzyme
MGTYFNRAVVSSQAFMRKFVINSQGSKLTSALTWITNGLEDAITGFMKGFAKARGRRVVRPDSSCGRQVGVFFGPEKKPARLSVDTVVDTIEKASSSVLFCFCDPTDKALLDACFQVGSDGKVMFGLINRITDPNGKKRPTSGGEERKPNVQDLAKVALYHHSEDDCDVYGHAAFPKGSTPARFRWEASNIQLRGKTSTDATSSKKSPPAVYIHHKFVVIDCETDHPVVYTGSANLSGSPTWSNDKNLVEIVDSPRVARIYLAEFLRLYRPLAGTDCTGKIRPTRTPSSLRPTQAGQRKTTSLGRLRKNPESA